MKDFIETGFGWIPSQISLDCGLIDLREADSFPKDELSHIVESLERRAENDLRVFGNLSQRFVLSAGLQEYHDNIMEREAVLSYLKSLV